MWPFNRKSSKPVVPAEMQEYYQAERRERVGIAWLLALATLLTTIVVAVGIFFGGRWVIRHFNHSDQTKSVAVNKNPKTKTTSPTNSSTGSKDNSKSSTPTPSQTNNQSSSGTPVIADDNNNTPDVEVPDDSNTTNNTSTPTTPTKQTNTAAPLPNTGPGDTAMVFVGVTTLATAAHSVISKRRLKI